ncbi:valine--tRNA ligase [Candidatus Pacearchaeota archaeon]|nr:valine--tRNA ligase [Candidatus Pacearchaeota archaeon]
MPENNFKENQRFSLKRETHFKETEEKIRKFWEKEKIYKFDSKSKKKIYSIDTPPPTVSGKMHMGHAFSYSQQDFIARYKRMRSFRIFYPFGTDDNGLATEKLIQKNLGIDLRKKTREEAVEICMNFLKKELPDFIQDWKNIGMSCDFSILYSTIDDNSRKVSQKSFLELAKKKLVYRREAPILWDVVFQTAIAQAELQDREMDSYFSDLVFKLENGEEFLIGTTRPELLGACVAIFVNSKDKRHKKLIGKYAHTPLYNVRVPILSDEKVDMEKGTGIVMCCTFGDLTDVEWYKKYELPLKMLINPDGTMNEKSGKYRGMKILEARKAIISDLKIHGLLKNQKKITHVVQVGERSGEPIEIINSMQWYVKYLDRKKEFLKASGKLNWFPKHMKHKLDNWIRGLQWDWSISRQRHFGVPIPVWYCKKCNETIFADEKQLPVNPFNHKPLKPCGKCGSKDVIPERDVFDTWFTSSSSPQLAISLMPFGLQGKLFPMSLRPQAQEIINFWLFYTMAKSQFIYGKNPWDDVTISGVVTLEGEKMAKSKGNIVNPREIMNEYGADALRYWAASSKLGEDMEYQEKELVAGKKFINKLRNSTRFVFMNLKNKPKKPKKLEKDDVEFLGKLNKVIDISTKYFEDYEYHKAKIQIEDFFWKYFCDYYLETVKKVVYQGNGDKRLSAQHTLYHSLLTILKLFAPIMPFITEEIYQEYFKKYEERNSIHVSEWPTSGKEKYLGHLDILKKILSRINQYKSNKHLPLNTPLEKISLPKKDYNIVSDYAERFQASSGAIVLNVGKEFKIEEGKSSNRKKSN